MKNRYVLIFSIILLNQSTLFCGWFSKKVTEETPLIDKSQYISLTEPQYPQDGFVYFYKVINSGDKKKIDEYFSSTQFVKRTPSWVFQKAQQFTDSDDLKEKLENIRLIKENPDYGF